RASLAASCKRTSCSAGRATISPTCILRRSSRVMWLEIVITAPSCRSLVAVAGGALAELLGLVGFDILEAIDDAAAELDELRAFTRPAPAFQRAVRNVPASGELDLGEVSGSHLVLLGSLRKPAERMAEDQNGVVRMESGSSGDRNHRFLRMKGDGQGDGRGMRRHGNTKQPGGTGREGGGSEDPDSEPVTAAPVGLDQSAPFRLCLEQVRQARAGRAGCGQHRLAMLPRNAAHGRLMKDAHDPRLDLAKHEGSLPENDLAEIVPLLEDDFGCPPRTGQPVLDFGAVALLAPDDQLLLPDQDSIL